MNDKITQFGIVEVILKDRLTDKILNSFKTHNTITTAGKDALAAYLVATAPTAPFMNYMQLGTLGTAVNTAVAAGATSLVVNSDILGAASTGSITLNPSSSPSYPDATTESVTVSAKSGTGPYTYTISATTYAHVVGEPVVMETLATDTALGTALGASASLAVQSSANNTWTDVFTFTEASNVTVYEAGIFEGSAGSGTATMYAHVTFSPQNLTPANSLQINWKITYS